MFVGLRFQQDDVDRFLKIDPLNRGEVEFVERPVVPEARVAKLQFCFKTFNSTEYGEMIEEKVHSIHDWIFGTSSHDDDAELDDDEAGEEEDGSKKQIKLIIYCC